MTTALPADLEQAAFRTGNGEYAWLPDDAIRAVRVLAIQGMAILGGELWAVRERKIWAAHEGEGGLPT